MRRLRELPKISQGSILNIFVAANGGQSNRGGARLPLLQSSCGGTMNLRGVIRRLTKERDWVRAEVDRLDAAVTALAVAGRSGLGRGRDARRRELSAAARARMAAAQRERRARERGVAAPRSQAKVVSIAKRRLSPAGLAGIRTAQKARWAKWRKQKAS